MSNFSHQLHQHLCSKDNCFGKPWLLVMILKRLTCEQQHSFCSPHAIYLKRIIWPDQKFKHKDSSSIFRGFHVVALQNLVCIQQFKSGLNGSYLSWKNNWKYLKYLMANTISTSEGTCFRNFSSSKPMHDQKTYIRN